MPQLASGSRQAWCGHHSPLAGGLDPVSSSTTERPDTVRELRLAVTACAVMARARPISGVQHRSALSMDEARCRLAALWTEETELLRRRVRLLWLLRREPALELAVIAAPPLSATGRGDELWRAAVGAGALATARAVLRAVSGRGREALRWRCRAGEAERPLANA